MPTRHCIGNKKNDFYIKSDVMMISINIRNAFASLNHIWNAFVNGVIFILVFECVISSHNNFLMY